MPEYGAQITITEAVLKKDLEGALLQRATDALREPFVQKFVVDGQRVRGVLVDREYLPAYRAYEFNTVVTTEDDPRLISVVARQYEALMHAHAALFRVNELPWWRWLWLKLRGRPVVQVSGRRATEVVVPANYGSFEVDKDDGQGGLRI